MRPRAEERLRSLGMEWDGYEQEVEAWRLAAWRRGVGVGVGLGEVPRIGGKLEAEKTARELFRLQERQGFLRAWAVLGGLFLVDVGLVIVGWLR